jgi:hypothetical protein
MTTSYASESRSVMGKESVEYVGRVAVRAVAIGLTLTLVLGTAMPLLGATAASSRSDPFQATSSAAAQQSAIQSIPIEKLDAAARAKVSSVLSNVTVFRRLPIRVVGCDPDLYLFLVRHPDVVVNIWEVLGIAQLQLRQTGAQEYRVAESEGTAATLEYIYHSHDTHIMFGQWTYNGSLLPRAIQGRCLAVLKTGYVRETDGRYYVTSRLDGFLSVEPIGAELLTKTLYPLVAKNADANFIQTVAFVGSLSRTAEVNSHGMQRLAAKLTHVRPEVRQELANVSASVGAKAAALPARRSPAASAQLAGRGTAEMER